MRRKLILIPFAIFLLLIGCSRSPESDIERRIRRVEQGLLATYDDPPSKRMSLADRMAYYQVPGVSIAVINDYQIEWAKGYGVLEAGSSKPVTAETLFQSASVAKPIVAVAALHYVERGLLNLDDDVNRSLVSWQVPENEFTTTEKVTLRRLLSHGAGVTVHGFVGYTQGQTVPTLLQILNGEPPANSPPIQVDTVPGTHWRYSGGGYMIVQQLLEDVTGMPFPAIMQEVVLKPLGMDASTFESTLPADRQAIAASGHRAGGVVIPGKWHTYPEMGAGGSMWSTPSDLAQFAIAVMLAYTGQSDQILSKQMAVEMLSPQTGSYGLGPFVANDGGDRFYFMHDGGNDGYKTVLVAYPERGQGVVIMTNADTGNGLWYEMKNSVSVEYGLVADYTVLYVGIIVAIVLTAVGILLWRRRKRHI